MLHSFPALISETVMNNFHLQCTYSNQIKTHMSNTLWIWNVIHSWNYEINNTVACIPIKDNFINDWHVIKSILFMLLLRQQHSVQASRHSVIPKEGKEEVWVSLCLLNAKFDSVSIEQVTSIHKVKWRK